jgi:hypothetical protein
MAKSKTILLVANGDLRSSANEVCWPAQHAMEQTLSAAVAKLGYKLVRAHPYKAAQKHGFISSQKEGMEVFAGIDPKTPLIVAEPSGNTPITSSPASSRTKLRSSLWPTGPAPGPASSAC